MQLQQQSSTSPKKPSPLSFGSPRTSPFKRADSRGPESQRPEPPSLIRSPSAICATIPGLGSLTSIAPIASPSQGSPTTSATLAPHQSHQVSSPGQSFEKKTQFASQSPPKQRETSKIPTHGSGNTHHNSDALGPLHPAQVRELRESFQVLDRNNDGQVTRDDVAEVLGQLGLDTSPSALAPYFPFSSSATLNLPTYLSTLSNLLASLSPPTELTAAFAAFDMDDSGQIDIEDLRDALIRTTPEAGGRAMNAAEVQRAMEGFTGRRALAKGMMGKEVGRRGDVFRYREFQSTLSGIERVDGQQGPGREGEMGAVKA